MLFPTCLVGSYPQPEWLIDRPKLSKQVPRLRMRDLWLIDEAHLEAAQDDATLLAIRDQERAGLDIVTDGEQRRESYSNRFATALEGVDIVNPGTTINRSGGQAVVPRIVGPIRRRNAIEVRDVQFLRRNTASKIKITLPGPFTMTQQAQDDFYRDEEALAMAFAAAVNAEMRDLKAAGADVIQLRQTLDAQGFNAAKIVGSSGFNLFKCKMFANARAPLDVVGTGSFIPENFPDTFATADIYMYEGKPGIKLGREKLFQGLKP